MDKLLPAREAAAVKPHAMVFALLAACAGAPSSHQATPALAALLAAPADRWADAILATLPISAADTEALAKALQASPNAPGAPAAIAVLGASRHAGGDSLLIQWVADRGALATDAALALGDRKAPGAAPVLAAAMDDRAADPALRTAAACALVRLQQARAAQPLLRAVMLAGTPAGEASGRQLGLPVRPRWALERYFVQRLVLREGDREFAYALDADASWPELERLADRLDDWLSRRAER